MSIEEQIETIGKEKTDAELATLSICVNLVALLHVTTIAKSQLNTYVQLIKECPYDNPILPSIERLETVARLLNKVNTIINLELDEHIKE